MWHYFLVYALKTIFIILVMPFLYTGGVHNA